MRRALGHLLDNAIEGTPEGGKITIELPKPTDDDDWRGKVIINDDGTGMTPDELARAEGELSADDSSEAESTGLGIRLARQLIEAHGGTLELSSEKGVGTSAEIILP